MATLTEFLTNIANAIRSKKGTTEPINAQDFATEIESIETGGVSSGTLLKDFLKKRTTSKLFMGYKGSSLEDVISYSDTEELTDMYEMFYKCTTLISIPLLDTSNVTNMNSMFDSCDQLTSIPLLDTSNVTNMNSMFRMCSQLTSIPLLNTSNVTNMYGMFYGCSKLISIPQLDTSNVTNMYEMFAGCRQLTTVPQLNTSKVQTILRMFYNCYALSSIPQLDTNNATSIRGVIAGCKELSVFDITSMDKITTTTGSQTMCENCYSLTKFIIRTMTIVPALHKLAFNNCYHFTGTVDATYNPDGLKDGLIYVPDDMVEQLKVATNWSVYADIIVPLSTLEE